MAIAKRAERSDIEKLIPEQPSPQLPHTLIYQVFFHSIHIGFSAADDTRPSQHSSKTSSSLFHLLLLESRDRPTCYSSWLKSHTPIFYKSTRPPIAAMCKSWPVAPHAARRPERQPTRSLTLTLHTASAARLCETISNQWAKRDGACDGPSPRVFAFQSHSLNHSTPSTRALIRRAPLCTRRRQPTSRHTTALPRDHTKERGWS